MSSLPPNAQPLTGRRIAVAGSRLKLASFKDGLARLGATVVPLPVIDLQLVTDTSAVDDSIRRIAEFDWVVFTSSHGARFFMDRVRAVASGGFPGNRARICAVGPGTARDLVEAGVIVDLIPETYNSEGVLAAMARAAGGLDGLRRSAVLIPRARNGRELLPLELAAAGCLVTDVACYQSSSAPIPLSELKALSIAPPDILVVTSPSAFRSFLSQMERARLECIATGTVIAALGPLTAAAAERGGKRVGILPSQNTIESMIESIVEHFANT